MLGFIFGIPMREEVFLLTKEEALRAWNDKISASKRHEYKLVRRKKKDRIQGNGDPEGRFQRASKRLNHYAQQGLWQARLQAFSSLDILIHEHYFNRETIL